MVNLFGWLGQKINTAQANQLAPSKCSPYYDTPISTVPLTLHIHKAHGGAVLEFVHYNVKTERQDKQLYVIPESDNLVEQMAGHIAMEFLRQ